MATADGTTTRASLGRTWLTGFTLALDASSVYFTHDAPPTDGGHNPAETLTRACRDGSNAVDLVTGTRFYGGPGSFSPGALAFDAERLYFTPDITVFAMSK